MFRHKLRDEQNSIALSRRVVSVRVGFGNIQFGYCISELDFELCKQA